MTPAIKILQQQQISYKIREYSTEDGEASYGMQAANALGQNPEQVFKTLLAVVDGNQRKPVVAVIPVAVQLDLKKLASHHSGRKAVMADPVLAERVTGYIVGGISPIGQKQNLVSSIDKSVHQFDTIFISGGKRGVQLELNPDDLINITNATVTDLSR